MKALIFLLASLALFTGCTSLTVRQAPQIDLAKYRKIFVLQPFNENHHVDEFFVYELRQLGRSASSGPETMMPEDTDAVLAYDTRWTWDFTTYLIEIDVSLRTAHTNKLIAQARFYQPSARPKQPEAVVHQIVQRLFGKQ